MSKGKVITLGVFTVWPFLYMVLFMCVMFGIMMVGFSGKPPSSPPTVFKIILPLHFLTMLEVLALLVIYIVHLFRTERVAKDKKALWAVVLLLGNMFAMPVFWYLYMWKDPSRSVPEQHNTGDR